MNVASDISMRERRAVERWRPGRRWYHPPLALLVIATSKLITRKLNSLTIEGLERFEATRRSRGARGLLTFSNHVSMFDDPLLVSNFAPLRYEDIRWVASDALNFFSPAWKAWLFTAGKCVPIVRGGGVDQPGYHFLRDKLLEGGWVHLFPEGGRTRDPHARLSAPFKLGVGRLLAETQPIAMPFYHYGMHNVLPVGAGMPRRGHAVRLLFGDAVDCAGSFLAEVVPRGRAMSERAHWEALAGWAHAALRLLELEVNPHAGSDGRAT